ncbi:MAG: APC family permease [Candidatus Nanopelagicales bacterium]|jgi:amino acid transporter|nr:APC family permease [Candidatus Nanopelagicales bacterium]MDP4714240.1 APC family permease [Candidatus Nanopelagicales bacterium]MDP4905674.1 APC family permease [Candidatus Nanopelagicales bacterium]MDP5095036.1 APC family permease [Candidatus Nanopelagicales bacterium]
MADLQPAPAETPETSLRKGRIGVIGIVFFVVAAAAPLVGMTGAVPVATVLGNGAGVPGAYLVVAFILLLFSVGYSAMSQHVTNAGAFFAYVGRGLGIITGVGSAFVSLVAYFAIQLAIFGFFGAVMAGQMNAQFGIEWAWWVWVFIAWAVVLILSVLSVDIGAKFLGILLTLELLSILIVAIAVFAKGGPEGIDIAASFSPGAVLAGGIGGTAGIALAFAFASYIGFEATAIYGEESREPKKTVPRATYTAIILIGIVFAFVTFAMVTALGASTVVDETLARSTVDDIPLLDPAAVLFSIAAEYVGDWMATVMSWLVLSSLFAGLLAFQNSLARYFFAMGRSGVFSQRLDHTNRFGAPGNGSITASVITAIIVIIFVWRGWDPVLNLFYWSSAVAVLAIVLVEILVSIAVIVYFQRTKADTRVWHTVIAPVLAIIGLALGAYLLMSRFAIFAGTAAEGSDPTVQAWALNPLGWSLVLLPFVAFAIGLLVGALRRKTENVDAIADLVG